MNYKKGELHGKVTSYNRSGKLESELEYKENQKHGDAKIYDKKGKLLSHKVYKEGKIEKVIVDPSLPNR
jgi:antitoxin component YwqK of YwqJK toxin-antitoxin module